MTQILIIYAHPNPQKSRLNKQLAYAASTLSSVKVHDLYQHYPDFDIDVTYEQSLLEKADIVVFQHPVYWYSCPSLMKEWLDLVFHNGYAYGEGGYQLTGKCWMSALSTGAEQSAYQVGGGHGHELEQFLLPFKQTAQYCGMKFMQPFISYHARQLNDSQIQQQAQEYKAHLNNLCDSQ